MVVWDNTDSLMLLQCSSHAKAKHQKLHYTLFQLRSRRGRHYFVYDWFGGDTTRRKTSRTPWWCAFDAVWLVAFDRVWSVSNRLCLDLRVKRSILLNPRVQRVVHLRFGSSRWRIKFEIWKTRCPQKCTLIAFLSVCGRAGMQVYSVPKSVQWPRTKLVSMHRHLQGQL